MIGCAGDKDPDDHIKQIGQSLAPLGGKGEDPNAHRLGTWTRVYRDDKRSLMIALIPGMGAGPDEMPITNKLSKVDPQAARWPPHQTGGWSQSPGAVPAATPPPVPWW